MIRNGSGIVIDASVALAWCFPDGSSDYADAVLVALHNQTIWVPSIWSMEVANALIVGERRKRIRRQESAQFVELLKGLRIVEDSQLFVETMSSVLPLARAHNLSAYDAAYLDVAIRHGALLATLDATLQKAGRAEGNRIFKI